MGVCMKRVMLGLVLLAACAMTAPAHAQFGGLLDKARKAQDAKQKFDSLNVSEEEEQKIGATPKSNNRL